MMDVIAALHTIDDSADHDSEIHENATHADKALKRGVHSAADEFTHGIAPVLAREGTDACLESVLRFS